MRRMYTSMNIPTRNRYEHLLLAPLINEIYIPRKIAMSISQLNKNTLKLNLIKFNLKILFSYNNNNARSTRYIYILLDKNFFRIVSL